MNWLFFLFSDHPYSSGHMPDLIRHLLGLFSGYRTDLYHNTFTLTAENCNRTNHFIFTPNREYKFDVQRVDT